MGKQSRTTLKTYFQTGDIPNEGNYIDLIDSHALLNGENTGSFSLKGNTTLDGTVTASGNISASGDVYSNNIEILTKDTMYIYAYGKSNSSYFDPDGNPAAANDWYGPVESGLVDRSSFNYGDNTQVQTLVSKLAHTGYIVPYKCKLIGFRALAAHDDGWNTTVGTLSFALYTADGGAATFNNTASSPAATLSLTQRNEATSVTPHAKGNPVTISDLDGTYEMDAGDLIFIRAKSSTASNSTANRFYVTFAILIQRIK